MIEEAKLQDYSLYQMIQKSDVQMMPYLTPKKQNIPEGYLKHTPPRAAVHLAITFGSFPRESVCIDDTCNYEVVVRIHVQIFKKCP
ncbi:hypothetical protein TNIN_107841 [Trichonephila inaurata madagascariensis]|uniref:Uncharacterized protein n=1 Tax=Trichonephila inaurata madagascariensis TaxID=2747483 RepID=A0A8X6YIN7_9ARAC|nr:hypothetical protein TNIN_107841 [Trichonephila inaurata madagascariensis]